MSSYISITDDVVEQQYGSLALALEIQRLCKQRADDGPEAELRTRQRRVQEFTTSELGPFGLLPVSKPKPSSSDRPSIDFRPDVRPRYEVELSAGAFDRMRLDLVDAAPHRVETGGYLFGHCRPRYSYASICLASGPGPDSRHGPHRVHMNHVGVIEAAFPDWLERSELRISGDWHSHPGGSPHPSEPDQRGWADLLRETGWPRYVGVIATRGELGWSWTQFHAWHVYRDGSRGVVVIEPAKINQP